MQRQKVAVAAEVKSVLDSWVRYEQQMKESEQAELTKSVINKVLASIKDEKTQKDILMNAVAEVERECIARCRRCLCSQGVIQSSSRARLSRCNAPYRLIDWFCLQPSAICLNAHCCRQMTIWRPTLL